MKQFVSLFVESAPLEHLPPLPRPHAMRGWRSQLVTPLPSNTLNNATWFINDPLGLTPQSPRPYQFSFHLSTDIIFVWLCNHLYPFLQRIPRRNRTEKKALTRVPQKSNIRNEKQQILKRTEKRYANDFAG